MIFPQKQIDIRPYWKPQPIFSERPFCISCNRCVMISCFFHLTIFQYKNLICMLNRRHPVCDDQCRSSPLQHFRCLLDAMFCFCIDIRCRLIQNQNSRIECQSASKRDQLPLTKGKRAPAFCHSLIVALRKFFDEAICPDGLQCGNCCFSFHIRVVHRHIGNDGFGKKKQVLQHDSHMMLFGSSKNEPKCQMNATKAMLRMTLTKLNKVSASNATSFFGIRRFLD